MFLCVSVSVSVCVQTMLCVWVCVCSNNAVCLSVFVQTVLCVFLSGEFAVAVWTFSITPRRLLHPSRHESGFSGTAGNPRHDHRDKRAEPSCDR